MKRIISFTLCVVLAFSLFSVTAYAERALAGLAGDLNGDSVTDIIDVALLRSKIINGTEFDKLKSRCADINTDNEIDVIDVSLVRKMIIDGTKVPEVYIMENTTKIDSSKPVVALTFDDGPNTTTTKQVLEKLEKYNVKASFFVIGNNINAKSAEVMKEAYTKGNEINSHSTKHAYMDKMTAEEIKADEANVENLIFETIGEYPKFFRPPYIAVSDTMYENINLGFICGITANDWIESVSVEERAERVLNKVKDGTIILLHDMAGNSKTVEALDTIIPTLQSEGYQFVTVSELFEIKNVTPEEYTIYTVVK